MPCGPSIIVHAVRTFNQSAAGPDGWKPLAIVLRHPRTGRMLGGLFGKSSYGWMYLDHFWVAARHRGQGWGRQLMGALEAEARRRGCRGIWLDTFSFQARGFYEKLGFRLFGTIEHYPPPHSRFFLQKRLRRQRKA